MVSGYFFNDYILKHPVDRKIIIEFFPERVDTFYFSKGSLRELELMKTCMIYYDFDAFYNGKLLCKDCILENEIHNNLKIHEILI